MRRKECDTADNIIKEAPRFLKMLNKKKKQNEV
jgi:hypothetical protein